MYIQRGISFIISDLTYEDWLQGSFVLLGLESISATRINNLFWMEIQTPKSMCDCASFPQNLTLLTCQS